MNTLSISTIIPTFNRAHLIRRAVISVIGNSQPGDEIIVVDDGSTDNTEQSLSIFKNQICYIRTPNRGAGAARNRGILEAKNPLIAFLDSDDEWMPGKLAIQRFVMEAFPEIAFGFSDFAVRYVSGREEHGYLINWHNDYRPWEEIIGPGIPYSSLRKVPENERNFYIYIGNLYHNEMNANYVFTSTLIVRKEAVGEKCKFAEDLPLYEDWQCYGHLASVGPAAYFECEMAWNHGHEGERLTDANAYIKSTARIKVLERVWGADSIYLNHYSKQYEEAVKKERINKAKALIAGGHNKEARGELRKVKDGSLRLWAIAYLPRIITVGLLNFRRYLSTFRK